MSAADPSLAAWRNLVDLDRLAAWMDGRGLGAGPIEDAGRPPGGTQNILIRFRRGEGDRHPGQVFRPAHAVIRHSLANKAFHRIAFPWASNRWMRLASGVR